MLDCCVDYISCLSVLDSLSVCLSGAGLVFLIIFTSSFFFFLLLKRERERGVGTSTMFSHLISFHLYSRFPFSSLQDDKFPSIAVIV